MKNSVYLRLSSFLFTFFFCWLVFLAFMPIWFKQVLHLSGAQIGTIYAANAIAAMTFQPIYGYISDRIGLRKHLLGFINFCVAMTAPFFLLVYQPLLESFFFAGVVAGALFMAIAYNAGVAAIESFVEKAGRSNDFEFGRARCWGSLGAAVGIFAAGLVFNLNPSYIFILASIMSLPLAAILYTTRLKAADLEIAQKNNISLADVKALFKIKNVWLFMIFILGSACVYSVFDQQFAIYYASLFPTEAEGNEAFGYLNSFQVFLEAAAMFAAPYFVNKLGAKRSLILAGTIMTCRMVGSGVVVNTIGISAIKLLHAVELSLLLVAVFKYIAKNFDNRLASVMYLVGYQLSNQLGAAILSPIVGSFTLFGAFVLVSDSKAPYQQREEAESAPEAA